MLGIPDKELKQAAIHADQTLSNVDRTLAVTQALALEATSFLRVARDIAADVRRVTSVLAEAAERVKEASK